MFPYIICNIIKQDFDVEIQNNNIKIKPNQDNLSLNDISEPLNLYMNENYTYTGSIGRVLLHQSDDDFGDCTYDEAMDKQLEKYSEMLKKEEEKKRNHMNQMKRRKKRKNY